MSKIEWTDKTWNPVTGCDAISPGCDHCYAESTAKRWKAAYDKAIEEGREPQKGHARYRNGFGVTLHHDKIHEPAKWMKSHDIFVCSMSDLFHKDIPYAFIYQVFMSMWSLPRHTFQVLTKRTTRMRDFMERWEIYGKEGVFPHIWLGTSVESRKFYDQRVPVLVDTPNAGRRYLSIEPLLEDLGDIDLTGIDWVIVGGESGPGARPMDADWVRSIRDRCFEQTVPFFFKQWGGVRKSTTGRILDGRVHNDMPHRTTKFAQTDPIPVFRSEE